MFAHRRGRLCGYVYGRRLSASSDGTVYGCKLAPVAPRVDTADLIDAQEVAERLGLAHRNTVSLYQRRYEDMPRPVVDLGRGRPKLWLRSEIDHWVKERCKTLRAAVDRNC